MVLPKYQNQFLIVDNLYWNSAFQDTTTNNAYSYIVVPINFPNTDGFVDSQLVMEVYAIIPSFKWVNVMICLSHLTMSWFHNDLSGLDISWVSNDF